MKTYIYHILSIFVIAAGIHSCAETTTKEESGGAVAISTRAISLAAALGGSDLYLKADYDPGGSGPGPYFGETLITVAGGLSDQEKAVQFPIAQPYYPLDQYKVIRLFAYSGKANGDKMVLTAGNTSGSDAVLSNYGTRGSAPLDPADEGNGTPGSSNDPANVLHFRHVMTQVIVSVEVNENETPGHVTKLPGKISFTLDGVYAKGEYPIRAKAYVYGGPGNTLATVPTGTGNYALQLGTNYLVPNGTDMVGQTLRSLIIDDYTAIPAEDLAGTAITASSPTAPNMLLTPGASYNLTITVERLGISGINIAPIKWQTREITGTPSYTPYNLTLDTGNEYANSGDGEITKIVFHTTNPERTYVGASSTAGGAIEFVTLPGTGNVASADIYTAGGLLLSTDVTSGYNKESLSFALPLSAAGMLPVNPTLAYGESNPYLVTTPVQFRNINNDPGKYYRQGTTLDMSTIITEDTDPPFTGITNFSGTYDGNGYWISEVMVQGAGLFNSNSGTLRNIRILTGTIDATGINIAGALCGSNTGTIAACINEAQVINAVNTAGGICGANSGSIIACLNTGNVSGGIIEGGICGTNSRDAEGVIKACVNTGMLARNTTVTNMGTICGTSIASAANIIRSSYGLVGSAAAYVGDTEVPVDSPGVGIYNCAILDPPAMKNQITAGEGETDRVIYKLNTELAADVNWKSAYQFVSDPVTTGILWPVPVKKP